MKIALTADWHIRGKDLDAGIAQVVALVTACKARDVSHCCIAGDVFDAEQIGDAHATTGAIVERLSNAMDSAPFTWHVIPGNHDRNNDVSSDRRKSAVAALSLLHNVRYLDRHGIVTTFGEDALWIVPMPWQYLGDASATIVVLAHAAAEKKAKTGRPCLLLAHVQVIGARMAGLHTCEPGTGWRVTREQLDAAAQHFDRVCLGDFHARQDLTGGRGGYVGALRQLNHGEEHNPAGFEIWDTETGLVEWVELDAAPRYRTVVVRGNDPIRVAPEPGFITRLRTEDRAPISAAERNALAECGVAQIEERAPVSERVHRAEVPAGALDQPHTLLDVWAASRVGGPDAEAMKALHAELDSLLAGKPGEAAETIPASPFLPAASPLDHVADDGAVTPDFLEAVGT